MPWQILSFDMFDRESEPSIDEAGELLSAGLAALWRRYLKEGIDENGRDTFTAFRLRVLPSGPIYDMPRGSQWAIAARRLRQWAVSPAHLAKLASHHQSCPPQTAAEEILRRAAAAPDLDIEFCSPETHTPDPPNSVVSPCGKWRVEWWISSTFADSYSSVEVVAMMVEDRLTGRNVSMPYDFSDLSIRPVRFLSPQRILLYSAEENAYYQWETDRGKVRRLQREEDAEEEYTPVVLLLPPQAVWMVRGLFGLCSAICVGAAIGISLDPRSRGAVLPLLMGIAFALLAAWLSTRSIRQCFDPANGVATQTITTCFGKSETRYLVEEFTGVERRRNVSRGVVSIIAVLAGPRELVLLDNAQAELVARRLGLKLYPVGFSASGSSKALKQ